MDALNRYDRWLHVRVMNPLFAWIQKLFHWNRFQLIRGFLLAETVTSLVAAGLFAAAAVVTSSDIVIAPVVLSASMFLPGLLGVYIYREIRPDLKKASDDFKAGRSIRWSLKNIPLVKGRDRWRSAFSLVGTISFVFLAFMAAVPGLPTAGRMGFAVMAAFTLCEVVESHLLWEDDLQS